MRSPHLDSISLKAEYLHQLFGILHQIFVSSLPFICLFSHSFISVWTHGYFFSTLGYNLVLKLLKLFQFWPLGDLSLGSCAPWTYPHQCQGIFLFSIYIVFGRTRCFYFLFRFPFAYWPLCFYCQ